MKKYALVIFTRKSGKIIKSLTGYGNAMLRLYALQNLTKTRDAILFDLENGEVIYYFEGTEDFPKIIDKFEESENNIENYCKGLLEQLTE